MRNLNKTTPELKLLLQLLLPRTIWWFGAVMQTDVSSARFVFPIFGDCTLRIEGSEVELLKHYFMKPSTIEGRYNLNNPNLSSFRWRIFWVCSYDLAMFYSLIVFMIMSIGWLLAAGYTLFFRV